MRGLRRRAWTRGWGGVFEHAMRGGGECGWRGPGGRAGCGGGGAVVSVRGDEFFGELVCGGGAGAVEGDQVKCRVSSAENGGQRSEVRGRKSGGRMLCRILAHRGNAAVPQSW